MDLRSCQTVPSLLPVGEKPNAKHCWHFPKGTRTFRASPAAVLSYHVLVAPSKPSANSSKREKSQTARALGPLTLAWTRDPPCSQCHLRNADSRSSEPPPSSPGKPCKSVPLVEKKTMMKELFNFECSSTSPTPTLGSQGSSTSFHQGQNDYHQGQNDFKAWALFPP